MTSHLKETTSRKQLSISPTPVFLPSLSMKSIPHGPWLIGLTVSFPSLKVRTKPKVTTRLGLRVAVVSFVTHTGTSLVVLMKFTLLDIGKILILVGEPGKRTIKS